MSRGFRISILIFASLLLAIFALRYLVIPSYGPALLTKLLTRWGVSESNIEEVSLAPGGMKIGHASLAWKAQGSDLPTMLGKIEALQVSGTIGSLSAGRFSHASAEDLSFEVLAGASSQEKKTDIQAVWAAALRLFPPLISAQIKNLTFVWSQPAQGQSLRMQGRAVYDEPSLTLHPGASLTYASTAQGAIRAELSSSLKVSRSSDGKDISVAPFSLRVAPFSTESLSSQELAVQTEPFLLMQQGASGKVSLKGEMAWLQHPEFLFGPFTIAGDLQFLPSGSLVPRAEIQFDMAKLELGFPLSQLHARLLLVPHGNSLSAAAISLQEVSVSGLGGTISSSEAAFNASDGSFASTLQIKAINLKDIFDMYPDSKVSGNGVLDGTLKLQRAGGLIRAEGSLESRPPGGVLNGDLSTWALAHPDNQGIAFASRALQNFHYSSLKANLEYTDSGQLVVRVELRGANPELEQGQPVHVNISIEENLPALFKSLRLLKEAPQGFASPLQ